VSKRFYPALACQMTIVLAVVLLAAFWPPERGAMLLVPIGGSMAGPANAAMVSGAALLAPGPLPGSLVVRGQRQSLSRAAIGHGILVLSAPTLLCGNLDTVKAS
jgi:uncharacterized RDD family membrane protein YckC